MTSFERKSDRGELVDFFTYYLKDEGKKHNLMVHGLVERIENERTCRRQANDLLNLRDIITNDESLVTTLLEALDRLQDTDVVNFSFFAQRYTGWFSTEVAEIYANAPDAPWHRIHRHPSRQLKTVLAPFDPSHMDLSHKSFLPIFQYYSIYQNGPEILEALEYTRDNDLSILLKYYHACLANDGNEYLQKLNECVKVLDPSAILLGKGVYDGPNPGLKNTNKVIFVLSVFLAEPFSAESSVNFARYMSGNTSSDGATYYQQLFSFAKERAPVHLLVGAATTYLTPPGEALTRGVLETIFKDVIALDLDADVLMLHVFVEKVLALFPSASSALDRGKGMIQITATLLLLKLAIAGRTIESGFPIFLRIVSTLQCLVDAKLETSLATTAPMLELTYQLYNQLYISRYQPTDIRSQVQSLQMLVGESSFRVTGAIKKWLSVFKLPFDPCIAMEDIINHLADNCPSALIELRELVLNPVFNKPEADPEFVPDRKRSHESDDEDEDEEEPADEEEEEVEKPVKAKKSRTKKAKVVKEPKVVKEKAPPKRRRSQKENGALVEILKPAVKVPVLRRLTQNTKLFVQSSTQALNEGHLESICRSAVNSFALTDWKLVDPYALFISCKSFWQHVTVVSAEIRNHFKPIPGLANVFQAFVLGVPVYVTMNAMNISVHFGPPEFYEAVCPDRGDVNMELFLAYRPLLDLGWREVQVQSGDSSLVFTSALCVHMLHMGVHVQDPDLIYDEKRSAFLRLQACRDFRTLLRNYVVLVDATNTRQENGMIAMLDLSANIHRTTVVVVKGQLLDAIRPVLKIGSTLEQLAQKTVDYDIVKEQYVKQNETFATFVNSTVDTMGQLATVAAPFFLTADAGLVAKFKKHQRMALALQAIQEQSDNDETGIEEVQPRLRLE